MLKQLIRMARAGDDEAARALVGWLAECLRAGTTPPPDLAAYFAQAFEQVASGQSANKRLNLGKRSLWARDYEIARAVWMLNNRGVAVRSSRDTWQGVYDSVAEQFGMGAYNVEAIYKRMHPLVEDEFRNDSPSKDDDAEHHARIQLYVTCGKLAEQLKKQGRK
ncbi:MAG: hypothetical protein WA161_14150 [Pseudomonas sp.]|uniref:hypothetical protein n=1 Tax=Pseudomonas sp. TaxID=306 RepID=UPI003BB4A1EE